MFIYVYIYICLYIPVIRGTTFSPWPILLICSAAVLNLATYALKSKQMPKKNSFYALKSIICTHQLKQRHVGILLHILEKCLNRMCKTVPVPLINNVQCNVNDNKQCVIKIVFIINPAWIAMDLPLVLCLVQ